MKPLSHRFSLFVLTTLVAALVYTLPVAAAANTVVRPSDTTPTPLTTLNTWGPDNVRTNATVGITTNQPRGDAPNNLGSLEFNTNTIVSGQDKADFEQVWNPANFTGRKLASLTTLSYEYYRASTSTTGAQFAPVLRLFVYDPGSGKTASLIWERAYNRNGNTPTDAWQSENILNDYFWMSVPGQGAVQNYNSTLSDWINGNPTGQPGDPTPINIDSNTLVYGINVGVGSGWGNTFTGFVDNIIASFGNDSVTANFEPALQCTTDCYVDDDTGSDANGGTSFADAKQHIQAGVNQVSSGGTVHVKDGTYNEAITINKPLTLEGIKHDVLAKGRSGPEAVIQLTTNQTPITINASNVTINGFTFDMSKEQTPWAITALNQPSYSNLKLQYNVFTGNPGTGNSDKDAGGAYLQNTVNTLIEGNFFSGLGSHAIFMAASSDGTIYRNNDSYQNALSNFSAHVGPHTNTLVENNRAVEDSLIVFATDGLTIRNNSYKASAANSSRVYLGGGDKHVTVNANTFTDMRAQAIQVLDGGYGYGGNSDVTITNNNIPTNVANQLANGGPWSLIDLRSVGGTTKVDGNTVTLSGIFTGGANGVHAVSVRGSGTGSTTITNNSLDGGNVASTSTPPNTGVLIRSNASGYGQLSDTAINVANNFIKNFSNGVAVYDFVASSYGGLVNSVNLTVNNNSITGNSLNGVVTGANDPTLNAERNWWGSQNGPTAASNPTGTGDKATGNVDFIPWLCSGQDMSNATGFQPNSQVSPCTAPGPAPAQAGKSYAISNGNPDKGKSQFYTITNNVATPLGPQYTLDFEDVAIQPQTGAIFASIGGNGTNKGYIYRVDGVTGAVTPIGPSGFNGGIMALKFRASDNTLWGWAEGKGLVQINTTTGVGSLSVKDSRKIEGIAWSNDGTTLYLAIDTKLYQLTFSTSGKGTIKEYAKNLPKGTESLDIMADGTLIGGAYNKQVTIFTYNVGTKTVTSGPTTVTTTFKSIEGLAYPR